MVTNPLTRCQSQKERTPAVGCQKERTPLSEAKGEESCCRRPVVKNSLPEPNVLAVFLAFVASRCFYEVSAQIAKWGALISSTRAPHVGVRGSDGARSAFLQS